MITFRSFSANVMVVLSQALIAAAHESASVLVFGRRQQ
jgi:hypothetical protein